MTYIKNDLPRAYGLIVSCASHLSPEIALLKSLEELCQSQSFAYMSLFDNSKIQKLTLEELTDLKKHFFYYSASRHNKNIDFILSSNKSVKLSEFPDYSSGSCATDLNNIAQIFKKESQTVYIADITRPEISNIGFSVVKAVIPGYLDLDVNHNFMQTKYKRLKGDQANTCYMINDNPHPFP